MTALVLPAIACLALLAVGGFVLYVIGSARRVARAEGIEVEGFEPFWHDKSFVAMLLGIAVAGVGLAVRGDAGAVLLLGGIAVAVVFGVVQRVGDFRETKAYRRAHAETGSDNVALLLAATIPVAILATRVVDFHVSPFVIVGAAAVLWIGVTKVRRRWRQEGAASATLRLGRPGSDADDS